jgi:hypothetical protein
VRTYTHTLYEKSLEVQRKSIWDLYNNNELMRMRHEKRTLFVIYQRILFVLLRGKVVRLMLDITGLPIDAGGLAKRSLESLRDLEDHAVREAWSQDRNREWHSITSESSGTRNTR